MKKVKCSNCKYEWNTKSKLDFVTCPNCQKKVRKEYVKVMKGGITYGTKNKS